MWFVFDLDGCCFDTLEVIRGAYAATGLRPPADVLTWEGGDWITPQLPVDVDRPTWRAELVRQKNVGYLRDVVAARPLAPFHVARRLYAESNPVAVLTGAPRGTVGRLRARHESTWPFCYGRDAIRTWDKMTLIPKFGPRGVFVDDQDKFIALPTGWRFVRYAGQSEQELYEEVTGT